MVAPVAEQEEAGTGKALGTAAEVEEVVGEVEVEEEGVLESEQVVEIPPGLRLERGGPLVGWGTSPSAPASARWGKQGGSWELVQEGVEEGEEMPLHWFVGLVGVLGVEE